MLKEKTYKVRITETLQRVVEVSALNSAAALLQIHSEFDNGNIALDNADFVGIGYEVLKEE